MATTSFSFPHLRLMKEDLGRMKFDRICFQFLIDSDNECTLLGYKMDESRKFKSASGVFKLKKESSESAKPLKISGRCLFVQLELTLEQVKALIDEDEDYLQLQPLKKTIDNYSYVVYFIPLRRSGVDGGGTQLSPCPPAIPPGG